MKWPSKLVCTDAISLSCENGGTCQPLENSKITRTLWTFDLKRKTFEISDEFEGKKVPNFSGGIVYQHDRPQNPDFHLMTIVLDTDQMVTFSPKLGPGRDPRGAVFWGVMQFASPGGTMTVWTTCEGGGNGS